MRELHELHDAPEKIEDPALRFAAIREIRHLQEAVRHLVEDVHFGPYVSALERLSNRMRFRQQFVGGATYYNARRNRSRLYRLDRADSRIVQQRGIVGLADIGGGHLFHHLVALGAGQGRGKVSYAIDRKLRAPPWPVLVLRCRSS